MAINVDEALSAPPKETEIIWTTSDVLFYHLSLGASANELQLTYERDLQALLTFGLVAGGGPSVGITTPPAMALPGIDVDLHRVLHAGQSITLHRPIPVQAKARSSQRVANIFDKQKAAIVELETIVEDADGPLWTEVSRIWIHGEGGFGGDAGTNPTMVEATDELTAIDSRTSPDQAAIYRLNGDYNPLHIDPEFAVKAGLEQPILHGLATFGIAALEIVRHLCDGDPSKLMHIETNFTNTVAPGQALNTSVSKTMEDDAFAFRTTISGTDNTVLKSGIARIAH